MEQFTKSWDTHVEVQYSPIHGLGIFATAEIPKDQLVMVIEGEVIDEYECERREEEENNVYIFWNGENYIDVSATLKIKNINHDCNPNCYVDGRDVQSLNLISCRTILHGEEITMDYGYDEIYDLCNCNKCQTIKRSSAIGCESLITTENIV